MLLLDLKAYLQAHRRASLADLSHRFEVAPEALRGMLEQWVRKGRVRRLAFESGCSGCCQGPRTPGASCASSDTVPTEIYEWATPVEVPPSA